MLDSLVPRLAADLALQPAQVARTLTLLDDGNTVPFIARYRKEVTGGLDEVQIEAVAKRAASVRALEARRAEILRIIGEQHKLTSDLIAAIAVAASLAELEDLYMPYRPKRRTRAMIARERGLEPLAAAILAQPDGPRAALAGPFVDATKDVPGIEEALAGARDIVAETIAEDAEVRGELRALFSRVGSLAVRPGDREKDPTGTYAHYYEFREALATLPPHRILAIDRGERAGVLKVGVAAPESDAITLIERSYPADDRSSMARDLRIAAADSYDRLLAPSLEREMRSALTARAQSHAIEVFALNLRPLLLQPPLRGRIVLGIDPGFRSGCKVAVVDETGKLLAGSTVYPHPPQGRWSEAKAALKALVEAYQVSIFAVGSGTAGRETELLVAELIGESAHDLSYAMVDEAGASVYSVSAVAREEFPDLDATGRGVVSIARRLQDPLAELVKVDPQAVGVGLYQHDLDQKELAEALDRVVESAVTFAGVDLNTASPQLLGRVAGLNRKVAAGVVQYRELHGKFRSRTELRKVPGLGPKAFEQAAGFLKVLDGPDPLDRTFIHPESYPAARALLDWLPGDPGQPIPPRAALMAVDLDRDRRGRATLAAELGIGEPTLVDILDGLARPGLDPRASLPAPLLRTGVLSLEDLRDGMLLQGTVRNVVDFGAFVDVGLKQAGLVHVSELSDRFVRSPHEVVHVGQVVQVRVKSVDRGRGRIALSMRDARP